MTIKNVTKYMVFGLLAATLPLGIVNADYDLAPPGNNLPIGNLTSANQIAGPAINTGIMYPSGNNLPTTNLGNSTQNQGGGNSGGGSNNVVDADVSIDDIDSISDDSATVVVDYDITGINLTSSNEARVYVRYGTSSSNLNKTSSSEYTSDENDTIEFDLDDLNDDTKYYVQAVVKVDGEYFYSAKDDFTTDESHSSSSSHSSHSNSSATYSQSTNAYYPTTTYYPTTAHVSTGVVVSNTAFSNIATLVIKNNVTAVGRGDTVSYLVEYKNISKSTISRARLVVSLPTEMRVTASMMGGMQTGNTFIMDLGSIAPGESESVMFVGKMQRAPLAGFVTAQATLTGDVNGQHITIDSADADSFGNSATALTGSAINSGVGASIVVVIIILAIAGLLIALIHYLTKDRPLKTSSRQNYGAY